MRPTPPLLTFHFSYMRPVICWLYPLITQKVSVRWNFRKGKIVLEFSQEQVCARTHDFSESSCIRIHVRIWCVPFLPVVHSYCTYMCIHVTRFDTLCNLKWHRITKNATTIVYRVGHIRRKDVLLLYLQKYISSFPSYVVVITNKWNTSKFF